MKVAVIGYSAAGKSTLAKLIAKHFKIPLLYLDTVNFKENWQERDMPEARALVQAFMSNESWVIDGNYAALYEKERLEQADYIVFMNFLRWVCLGRAFSRYRKFRGKVRESMTDGCNEKFDFEFAKWILHDGRNANRRAHYNDIMHTYPQKIAVLKNDKQVNIFLSSFLY